MTQEPLRLRPDIVPLQWHEAVAVVQTVARQALAAGDVSRIPTAADLAVDRSGGIHVMDSVTRSKAGDEPAALAALLGELLRFSSSTPSALASLADASEGTTARFASVEDFSQALQFFERPLSQHELAAHAARLATTHEQRRLNTELEQLTQKARDTERPVENEIGPARRRRNGRRVAVALVAAGFLVVAIVAGAMAGWNNIGAETMREVGSRLVERARTEAKAMLTSDAPAPPKQSTTATDQPERRRHRPVVRSDNPPATPLPVGKPPLAAVSATRAPTGVAAAPDPTAVVVDEIVIVKASNYSGANRDVEPPVITRPHLRAELTRPALEGQLATLLLDIDAEGVVQQVRLGRVSADQRYYAAMLVAAAKAWRFRPALKEGKPVPYRLRLVVVP
jgi:hypothetical protein